MRYSCFGTLTLLILLVAVIVFALTPQDRHSVASVPTPGPLWSSR
jgi:cbb3-type cytochrome oxidase subunit 3